MLRNLLQRPVSWRLLILGLVLAAGLGALAVGADEASDRRAALRLAQEPLRDRRWAEAAEGLKRLRLSWPGTQEGLEAWVLEARALLEAGKAREALDSTSEFLKTQGPDAWAGRMKHTAAEAYAALGDPAQAATTLAGLADEATAPEARARIGALHLKLADEDFDGVEGKDDIGRPVKRRDVARALASYRQALDVGLLPADAERARERVALCLEETGDPAAARAAWAALSKEFDDPAIEAKEAKEPKRDPAARAKHEARAERWLVGQGRAALKAGQPDDARKLLTQARERFPQGALAFETVLLLGEERLTARNGTVDDLAFEEGVAWLTRAVLEHRADPRAGAARRRLAEAYEARGQAEKAAQAWGAIADGAPESAEAPVARDRAAQALLQAGRYDDAVAEWNRFLAAYANHPLWPAVREKIALAALATAEGLVERGDVAGGVAAFQRFAEERPDDHRAPDALMRAALLLRGAKDAEGALRLWRAVAGRYGETPQAAPARLLIAQTLEDDLKRLDDAVAAYEEVLAKHAGSPAAKEAEARLARLKGKHLELRMERVLGVAQAPVLRVVTRNIEGLKVRVYRLGLEEYFRRKGTLEGVEALQLEVVKPDVTAAWDFEGYRPYALLEADRPLPVTGPGGFVVVAGDDDLTATVLFLVSDIETVVKHGSTGDLLVWAFDRATQAPVAGARVLAPGSDGRVAEHGVTGADGVWTGRTGAQGRVLVLSPQGAASSEIAGAQSSGGFSTRAYVTTDRPVYRPGQEVAWRAVLLRANGGGLVNAAGAQGRLEVLDPRGQSLWTRDVEADALGVFDGAFPVDAEAPLGTWRLRLSDRQHGGTWDGTFQVLEYRKPEFLLDVEAAKPVVPTGGTVEARIVLTYAFGGPVPGAEVEWMARRTPRVFSAPDPDDVSFYLKGESDAADRERRGDAGGELIAQGKGRTLADGTLALSFAAGDADQDAEIVIFAQAEDVTRRWVTGGGRVAVARRDHLASVKPERALVKPKEPFAVEVRTQDALGSPVARSGVLKLLRVTRSATPVPGPVPAPMPPPGAKRAGGGRRPVSPPLPVVVVTEQEAEVASYPLTTDARGRGEVRLDLPAAGRFRVSWRAVDARGGIVEASADVEALGEAQDLSKDARLVPARRLYVEGEEAEVLLSVPLAKGLALITYEGERVLKHRFVPLTGTSTLLRLPLSGEHAPNVTLAAAVPGPERLFEAQTEVVVLRRLTVDVRFAKERVQPGEELEVTLTTKDASGRPVAAQVGLSILDAALYAIAPDASEPILPYFYGARRGHGVSTRSSIGWRAYGTTRETNADLLDEAAAKSGNAAELAARGALRLALEARQRGDLATAVAQALAAQQAAPDSWDARALLAELRTMPDAQEHLKRLEPALDALRDAEKLAEGRPMAPAAAPAPMPPGSAEELADAPFEGAQDNALHGVGGGGGGAFKGRGGSKDRKSGGGGRAQARIASLDARFEKADGLIGYTDVFNDAFGAIADVEQLAELLTLRSNLRDSALWLPRVTTDAQGRATVKVKLPDNLTTWRAVAQGVSAGALVGEGRAALLAQKDLLVRVDAPRALTQGDRAVLPSAVHNGTDTEVQVGVVMKVDGLALSGEPGRVAVPPSGSVVVDREVTAPAFGPARVEVAAVTGAGGDRTEARLPVLARGVRFVDGRSGLVTAERGDVVEAFVEVPADVVPGSTRLLLSLHPGLDAAVLEALLALDVFPYGCVEQTVHRFLPALEARAALVASGSPGAAQLQRLDESVARGAARLVSLMNPDGTFGWFRGGAGNPVMSAYGLLGLVGAREAGVKDLNVFVTQAAAGVTRLLSATDEDGRALLHLALARAGALNADAYAATFRRRSDDLSVPGLAWLALAAKAAGRAYDVEELGRLLLARRTEQGAQTFWKARAGDCFLGSDREATGLAVKALLEAGAASEQAERGVAWLLANRPQGGLGTTKDLAAFVGALSSYVRVNRVQGFGGQVEVLLDGKLVHTLSTGPGAPAAPRVLLRGGEALAAGRHTLLLRLAGQGRLSYALRLEGVRATDDLPDEEQGLRVIRRYLVPEPQLLAGEAQPVKPGFGILRPAARPKWEPTEVQQAGSGEPVLVRLTLEAPRDLDYVLVEDPLPAGFEVVAGSVKGTLDWEERRDTRQVFFVSKVAKGAHVLEYVLQATHLGRFTALGTTALALYAPEIHGRAAGRVLTVVPRDAAHRTDAETLPTPDQLYAEAQRLIAAGQRASARRILEALKAEQPLSDEVLEEVEGFLVRLAIEDGDAKEVVRAREALLRRNAGRIPDDLGSARAIAAAYRAQGQHETAATLFRDLVARGFALEVGWKDTLAARGREVEGLDALDLALHRGPVSNATAAAAFKAAQRWRELRRPEGRGGRPAGKPMDEETLDALWSLTAHFASHRVADPAGYALVEALRRSKDLGAAGAAATAFLTRFPESVFADDTRYFLAETRYRAFEEAPAPATAEAVRAAALPLTQEGRYPNPDGTTRPWSEFRPRAFHLLARVAHVLGDLEQAQRLYENAREIEDAREALAWLTAQGLAADDLVVKLGAGTVELPVRYRNLSQVTLASYPVDVQVLFAVRKTLDGLNRIDLSGITPQKQWQAPLPAVPGRVQGSARVDAGVPAEGWGAWLVVLKAGDLEAATLVIKTGLVAELQHVGEKVRVNVRDAAGAPVRAAYVAVSDGQRIRARGLTDARGVFEAPGVGATAYAVVTKDDQVALGR